MRVTTGPGNRAGSDQFVARFTLYCEINEDKYYVRTDAISLAFTTDLTESLRGEILSVSIDFMGDETQFAAVEGTRAFQAVTGYRPWRCAVEEW